MVLIDWLMHKVLPTQRESNRLPWLSKATSVHGPVRHRRQGIFLRRRAQKRSRVLAPGFKVSPLGGNYAPAFWTESGVEVLTPLAAISLLRSIWARRIGLITNTASRAAIELNATDTMNTDCQP